MIPRSSLAVATTISAILGVTWGVLMIGAAADHNPQGINLDLATGHIDYLRLSMIFLSWAAAITGAGLFVFFMASAAMTLLRRMTR